MTAHVRIFRKVYVIWATYGFRERLQQQSGLRT
jgi:hypothetical protein